MRDGSQVYDPLSLTGGSIAPIDTLELSHKGADLPIRSDCEDSGFTLIEVIVSLALISLVSITGYALIDALAGVQSRIDSRYTAIEHISLFTSDLRADLTQARPESLRVSSTSLTVETFACGALTTISIYKQDSTVVRSSNTCPELNLTIGNVEAVEFSVRDGTGTGVSIWPGEDSGAPHAVEMRMNFTQGSGAIGQVVVFADLPVSAYDE